MEIKNISQKIFRTASSKAENRDNHTNPFGVNFKGNMINADVFEPAFCGAKESIAKKAANKGRMWASAIVGSMNSVNESISRRLDSVVSFGNRIKSNVSDLWNQANNIEINLLPDVKNIINNMKERISDKHQYGIANLGVQEVSKLDAMFQDHIMIKLLGV